MAQNKRTRIIAAITALAGCALFIDRVFLGSSVSGPASADAAAEPAARLAGSGGGVRGGKTDAWRDRQARLASRLEEVGDNFGLNPRFSPDGFAPPPAFRPAPTMVVQAAPPPKPAPTTQPVLPGPANAMSIVFTTPAGRTVIVEVKRLRVGEEYGGMRLIALEPDGAVFEGLGERKRVPFRERGEIGEDDKVKVRKPGTAP